MNFIKKIMLGLIVFGGVFCETINAVKISAARITLEGLNGIVLHNTLDEEGNVVITSPEESKVCTWHFTMQQGPNGPHTVAVGLENDGKAYSYISDLNGMPLGGRSLHELGPDEKLPVPVCLGLLNDETARFTRCVNNGGEYALRLVNPDALKYGRNWEFVLEVVEDEPAGEVEDEQNSFEDDLQAQPPVVRPAPIYPIAR